MALAAEDITEATLELTLLSIDGLKKPKQFLAAPFAVAWIDSSLKKFTKTLDNNTKLHFPLPPLVLQNPSSLITIQILSSRLPFSGAKLVATATLPLSSVRLGGEVRTLQLRKPSGRARGTIHIVARILWCLGEMVEPPDFSRIADPMTELFGTDCQSVLDPSAPPMPEGCGSCQDFLSVDSAAPMVEYASEHCDCHSVDSVKLGIMDENGCSESIHVEQIGLRNLRDRGNGKGAWRSFLIGLASGALAAVLVVAAGFSEG